MGGGGQGEWKAGNCLALSCGLTGLSVRVAGGYLVCGVLHSTKKLN